MDESELVMIDHETFLAALPPKPEYMKSLLRPFVFRALPEHHNWKIPHDGLNAPGERDLELDVVDLAELG